VSSAISPSLNQSLPPLDVHAHIDPTVTDAQLGTLGNAIVFAVTRTLDEAAQIIPRADARVLWGAGVHPGRRDALEEFDASRFTKLAGQLDFVGEIGLDREQRGPHSIEVLTSAISTAQGLGQLCSVHSTGRQREVVEVAAPNGCGVILHWFTGSRSLIEQASAAGCYFSINNAMSDAQITALPVERLLPETDYPFTRKAGSARPGDIAALEYRCAALLRRSPDEIRQMWYRNLRSAWLDVAQDLSSAPPVLHRPLTLA